MRPTKEALQVPAAFGQWLVRGDKLVCRQPGQTVTVRAPGPLLHEVMTACDGSLPWAGVVTRLGKRWATPEVEAFLGQLAAQRVLVEASELWAHWSDLVHSPCAMAAGPEVIAQLHKRADSRLLPGKGRWLPAVAKRSNRLAALLAGRESTRTFEDLPLSAETLCSILWAAHGVTRPFDGEPGNWHRTVASGGDMHSARWFVAVLRELPAASAGEEPVPAGVYEARFHREGGASMRAIDAPVSRAWQCLGDPRVLRFASALVLAVYDVAHPARKYGNRATLFATMEAGQCMQNAQLMASELAAAGTLRGDTIAAAALAMLGLRQHDQGHWMVMPGLVLGARPTLKQRTQQQLDRWLHFGPSQPGQAAGESLAFAFTARPALPRERLPFATSGRAEAPELAVAKAEAEAWERLGWAEPSGLVESRIGELPAALLPQELVAYSTRQYANPQFPFRAFSTRSRHLWKQALDVASGNIGFALADCLYPGSALPPPYSSRLYTGTSTSGMAAGFTVDEALERATLELIERDAFVCAWLAGRAPSAIDIGTLPRTAARRITALQASGLRIVVQDLSTRWAPVISIFAQDDRLPLTATTAAAHLCVEQALSKALDEVEGRVANARRFAAPRAGTGNPLREIERYYRQARSFRRSDFFAAGPATMPFGEVGQEACHTWSQLKARMHADGARLHCVDMTPSRAALEQGRRPIQVVRALIPGLVPIWFGRGTQPEGMARFISSTRTAGERPRGFYTHPFT